MVERELQKVLVTEGGPRGSAVGNRFVLVGCPQPLSWSLLNPFCPELLGPVREHKDLVLKASGN